MTVLSDWRSQLDARQQKEITFAERYAADPHGATGHNSLLLIARLAELLDIAAGVKAPPPPPDPDAYRLTFGKHSGKTLPEIAQTDPTYLQWLASNARDADLREAIQHFQEAEQEQQRAAEEERRRAWDRGLPLPVPADDDDEEPPF